MGVNATTDEALGSIHDKYLNQSEEEYENEAICDIAYDADHAEMLRDFVSEWYARFKKMNTRRQGLVQLHMVSGADGIIFITKLLCYGRIDRM